MSSLDRTWAKSRARSADQRGELLTEHLLAARDTARLLSRRTGTIPGTPERFWDWIVLACLLHDAGKIPDGFQQMVGNPGPQVPWGQRHEVYSLGFAASVLTSLPEQDRNWVMLGIALHHRPLTGDGSLRQRLSGPYRTPDDLAQALGPVDPDTARELHAWLLDACGAERASPPGPGQLTEAAHAQLASMIAAWADSTPDSRDCLTGVLVQGAVTLADRAASAHMSFLMRQPLDASYPPALASRLASKNRTLFPYQQQALSVDGHMLLRAPTGAGKTEAALLWAARQTEQIQQASGGIPRVFYTLPYLASINAMSRRLRGELNRKGEDDVVGVAHSRAASYYLKLAARGDCVSAQDHADRAAGVAVARTQATRLFREPVRVGTPYQLLRGALAGPEHSGILIDSANSVFILDELHAYEPMRLGMILAMAGLWARLGGRIGVVSATLPEALAGLFATALGEAPAVVEPDSSFTWPVRHRLELADDHLTAGSSVREIRRQLADGASVLVVANNVADAISLYEALAPAVQEAHGPDAATLLHARFRAGDRAAIEERILGRFEAGKPRQPGLLVATQTVEVSLNVDFDILHTSGAPLEPMIQRFGRVNRLGSLPGPAPVVVHPPAYGPRRGNPGTEYADGVYEADPARAAWQILARHDHGVLDEKLFGQWLNEVYASDWGQEWRAAVARELRKWNREWLQFRNPFSDRSGLTEAFDKLFDGQEAILEQDRDAYRDLLNGSTRVRGRLLAADLLLPLPAYATKLGRYDKKLQVTVIDGDYDPLTGLQAVRGRDGKETPYQPGEVL